MTSTTGIFRTALRFDRIPHEASGAANGLTTHALIAWLLYIPAESGVVSYHLAQGWKRNAGTRTSRFRTSPTGLAFEAIRTHALFDDDQGRI